MKTECKCGYFYSALVLFYSVSCCDENIFKVCLEFQRMYGLVSEELNIWAYMAYFGDGRQGTN